MIIIFALLITYVNKSFIFEYTCQCSDSFVSIMAHLSAPWLIYQHYESPLGFATHLSTSLSTCRRCDSPFSIMTTHLLSYATHLPTSRLTYQRRDWGKPPRSGRPSQRNATSDPRRLACLNFLWGITLRWIQKTWLSRRGAEVFTLICWIFVCVCVWVIYCN